MLNRSRGTTAMTTLSDNIGASIESASIIAHARSLCRQKGWEKRTLCFSQYITRSVFPALPKPGSRTAWQVPLPCQFRPFAGAGQLDFLRPAPCDSVGHVAISSGGDGEGKVNFVSAVAGRPCSGNLHNRFRACDRPEGG